MRFLRQIEICPPYQIAFHTLCISQVHFVLYRKFATVYRQFMVDIHLDSCALRAGKNTTLSGIVSIAERRKYGNYWDPCPLSVCNSLSIQFVTSPRYFLQGRRYEHNVPMFKIAVDIFPSGEYRIDTKTYTIVNGERKYLTLSQSYGEVKYTSAEQWKK